MKEVNITLNERDIEDLQTILDNAEAYADTHSLRGSIQCSRQNQDTLPERSSTPDTNEAMKRKPRATSKSQGHIQNPN